MGQFWDETTSESKHLARIEGEMLENPEIQVRNTSISRMCSSTMEEPFPLAVLERTRVHFWVPDTCFGYKLKKYLYRVQI